MGSLKFSFLFLFLAAAVFDTNARSIYRPDANPEESRSRRDVTGGDEEEVKRGQVTTHSLNIIRQTPNAPLIQHAHSDTTSKARVSQSHRRAVDDQIAQTRSDLKAKEEDNEEEEDAEEAEDASGEAVEKVTTAQKEALPVSIAPAAVTAGQVFPAVSVAPQAQQNKVVTAAQVPVLQVQLGVPAQTSPVQLVTAANPAATNQIPASLPANQLRTAQQQSASKPALPSSSSQQLHSQPLTGYPMVAHPMPTHANDQVVNKGQGDKEGSAEDDDASSGFEDDDEYTAEDKRKMSESKSSSTVTAPQAPSQLVQAPLVPAQKVLSQAPVQQIITQPAASNHPELIAAAMPVATVQQAPAAMAPQAPTAVALAATTPAAAATPATAAKSPVSAKAAKTAASQAAMQEPITASNIRKYLKPIKFGGSLKAMPKLQPQDDFLQEMAQRKKLKNDMRKKKSEKKEGKGKE